MHSITVEGRSIELNDAGYLVNFDDWDKSVAEALAEQDQLELSDCHWIAIDFLRKFYGEYEVPPAPRTLIKAVGDQISEWGCNRKTLEQIFPLGGCKHACRLAGLPDAYCHTC